MAEKQYSCGAQQATPAKPLASMSSTRSSRWPGDVSKAVAGKWRVGALPFYNVDIMIYKWIMIIVIGYRGYIPMYDGYNHGYTD